MANLSKAQHVGVRVVTVAGQQKQQQRVSRANLTNVGCVVLGEPENQFETQISIKWPEFRSCSQLSR